MSKKRFQISETTAFLVLLVGMSVAGYTYQRNKDTVDGIVLVPSIIGGLLIMYVVYCVVVRFLVKR